MDITTLIGTVAAILTTAANIPQAYKIIRDRSAEGISATTYFILLAGVLSWVAYGFLRDDLPVIIANGISAMICTIILILNFTSQRNVDKVHEKVLPKEIQEKAKGNPQG